VLPSLFAALCDRPGVFTYSWLFHLGLTALLAACTAVSGEVPCTGGNVSGDIRTSSSIELLKLLQGLGDLRGGLLDPNRSAAALAAACAGVRGVEGQVEAGDCCCREEGPGLVVLSCWAVGTTGAAVVNAGARGEVPIVGGLRPGLSSSRAEKVCWAEVLCWELWAPSSTDRLPPGVKEAKLLQESEKVAWRKRT
jgi:hypothetical protein